MEYCTEYAPLISAAVDGEISPEERRELMEHLAQCPACREAYEQMLAMHMAFEELDTEVPGDLAGDVMAKVRSQQKRPRRRYWLQLSVAAACCALALLGYWSLGLERADNTAAMTADSTLADDGGPMMSAAASDDATARTQGEEDPAGAEMSEETDASDEQIMENVLTHFRTAPKVSMYSDSNTLSDSQEEEPVQDDMPEAPNGVTATTTAVEVATLSSDDPGLVEWMAANTTAQEYTQDGATAWLITVEQFEALEAFLTEKSIPFSLDCIQLVELSQADSDEVVCVVYLGTEEISETAEP